MIVETFRMLFERGPDGRGGWRRTLGWLVTIACLAGGAWLAVEASRGRAYPWSPGKMFWAAALLWLGVLRARFTVAGFFSRRTAPAMMRLAAISLNRALILALCFVPGLLVGWYAVEAANRPSRNSRGQDICDVSSAQYCVSGPRALIPWAVILLVFGGLAAYYFIWSWTKAKRRECERPAPLAEAAKRRVEAVIPPNDPGASSYGDQPVPQARPPDKDLRQSLQDLSDLVKMKQAGELTPAEFDALKAQIVQRATDGE